MVCPQRSLEDEISRTTAQDLPIFAISYLVIFLYISLALGSYTSWRRMLVRGVWGARGGHRYLPARRLSQGTPPEAPPAPVGPSPAAQEADPIPIPIPLQVDAKVTLGLGGVAVVLGAVMAAMGFFAYLGIPSSLVVLQVVPFLVLAVGADNIFIFVLEYQVRGACRPQTPRGFLDAPPPQIPSVDSWCSLPQTPMWFPGAPHTHTDAHVVPGRPSLSPLIPRGPAVGSSPAFTQVSGRTLGARQRPGKGAS